VTTKSRTSQALESEPITAAHSAVSVTGPVGVVLLVATLLIFLLGIPPARWLVAASLALTLVSGLILRHQELVGSLTGRVKMLMKSRITTSESMAGAPRDRRQDPSASIPLMG
jgi:hypothetical protein